MIMFIFANLAYEFNVIAVIFVTFWKVWFGRIVWVDLVWLVWLVQFGLIGLVWCGRFALVGLIDLV